MSEYATDSTVLVVVELVAGKPDHPQQRGMLGGPRRDAVATFGLDSLGHRQNVAV